jgi:uncharacterized protein YeaO (DUF488 family)
MAIVLKRAYEKPSASDGTRVLVERLWPRGLTKEAAALDAWLKDVAPSHELRKWYHARPRQWEAFRRRYLEELSSAQANGALEQLYEMAQSARKLTLVYAARDTEHNSATILKELLEGMRKPPVSTGPGRAAAIAARARRR